jgi:hypothetical protein
MHNHQITYPPQNLKKNPIHPTNSQKHPTKTPAETLQLKFARKKMRISTQFLNRICIPSFKSSFLEALNFR